MSTRKRVSTGQQPARQLPIAFVDCGALWCTCDTTMADDAIPQHCPGCGRDTKTLLEEADLNAKVTTDLPVIKGAAPNIITVVPGIRPTGVPVHDQGRVATPAEAIRSGADILVIGRAVTAADDPAAAAEAIAAEVANAI